MSESSSPESGAALLARIKPRLREVSTQLCLRPDLLEDWESKSEELDAANLALEAVKQADAQGARLGTGVSAETKAAAAKVNGLAAEVAALEAEIEATQVRFRLRALPKDKWEGLTADHPPRKDNVADLYYGANRDGVLDAAVRLCLFEPVFEDCAINDCEHADCGSWQQFVSVCNSSEWAELRRATNEVNGAVVDAPKSELASRILSSNASVSKPRRRGVSTPESSTGS
jgi:hypothetical protein